ncbi:hypothetical protein AN958_12423 [Leucoagaricus sp. SymC.cos]|nr:hypothetical protein AN958_12423 [Leucoagaricus sp. SymC.cos]
MTNTHAHTYPSPHIPLHTHHAEPSNATPQHGSSSTTLHHTPHPSTPSSTSTNTPNPDFDDNHPGLPAGDDPDPKDGPGGNPDPDDNPDNWLAVAIEALIKSVNLSAPPPTTTNKAHVPKAFTGEDPLKLENFLFQYSLYFCANSCSFSTNADKVNFILTYLSGVVSSWFQVSLHQEDLGIHHSWADSWPEFSEKLCLHFGLANWVGKVAKNLESLHMKHGDKIATYNIDFMWYSTQLDWGDSVFTHRYYKGLPNCLQDQISIKPHGFQEMMCVATVYDNCHWEHKYKCACAHTAENLTPSSQPHKNPSSNSSSQQQSSSNNCPSSSFHSYNKQQLSSTSGPTNNNKNSSQPPQHQSSAKSSTPTLSTSSSSSQPPAPKKDLSNILGKDGKLMEAEKQHCIKKNLCSYCSIFSHQVETCKCKEANQKACGCKAELPALTSASAPAKGSEK